MGQIALAVGQGRRPAVPAGMDAELAGLIGESDAARGTM